MAIFYFLMSIVLGIWCYGNCVSIGVIIPNRSLGRHFNLFHFFRSVHDISEFLSASWPHPCLAVARYAFTNDVNNLLEINTKP